MYRDYSKTILEKILHSKTALIAITTLTDGVLLEASDQFLDLFGYRREEVINKSVRDMDLYSDLALRQEIQQEISEKGYISEREMRLKGKDGKIRLGIASFEKISMEGEDYIITIWNDLTKTKYYQEELRKLSSAIEQSSNIVIIIDPEGYIEYVNKQFQNITGFEADEVLGKHVSVKQYTEFDPFSDKEIRSALRQGHSWNGEIQSVKKNGEVYWEKAQISPIFDPHHNISNFLLIKTDITEEKKMQDQLSANQELYQNMFFKNKAKKLLIDPETRKIEDANPSAIRFYGYPQEQLKGMQLCELTLEDEPTILKNIQLVMNGEKQEFEAHHKLSNGEIRDVQTFSTPIQWKEKRYLYSIIMDITDKKQAERKLIHQNRFDHLRAEIWRIAVIAEDQQTLLDELLSQFGMSMELDRISFVKKTPGNDFYSCIEQWNNAESSEKIYCELPGWFMQKAVHKTYFIPSAHELQKISTDPKKYFSKALSLLVIPFGKIASPEGFFVFEDWKVKREWEDKEIEIFKELSNIVQLKSDSLQTSEQIIHSERKFRLISEASRDVICIHDLAGNFVYVSPASEDILGYPPGELIGESPCGLFHPKDREYVIKDALKDIQEGRRNNNFEYRIRKKDGKYIWFETIAQPIENAKGETVEIQTSSRDITERKMTERKLRESEEKYRNIFESMFDVYAEVELDTGKILEISPSVVRISGYSRDELLGQNIQQFYVIPEEREKLIEELKRKKKVSDFDVTLKRKTGEHIICSYAVRLIFDETGKPYKTVGTLRDVSQRKRHEKQLKRAKEKAESASRAKSEFLANMSHEIRTPLNAVLGFSEVLMNKVEDVEHKNYLEAILSSGRTLLALINDILDLSKIEAGKLQIVREPVQLPAIIEDIQHIFEKKIKEKNLELLIDIAPELPEVLLLDEVRIRQVLFNLVGNAIKFTEKGHINLKLEVKSKGKGLFDLKLVVEDTGIGIPRKQQKHIFGAFDQKDGQSSRKYAGTGLGLSITKKLVESMNGEINLSSRIGKGSKFTVMLFDIEESLLKKTQQTYLDEEETNIEFKPATILIADDIQYNIDTVRNLLDSDTIKIIEAQSAEKALEILKINTPELVLMDLRFPDMSGYEAAAMVRAEHKNKHTPILAFTAATLDEEEDNAKNIFDDFIKKPVSKNELYAKLKKYLAYVPKDRESDSGPKRNTLKIQDLGEEDYQKLLKILENEVYPFWQNIKDSLIIFEIEKFVEHLQELQNYYMLEVWDKYIQELSDNLENFDVDNLQKQLQDFDEIYQRIKNEGTSE